MARIGICGFLGRGHLNPALALAVALRKRGHAVGICHLAIAERAIVAHDVDCLRIDCEEKAIPFGRQDRLMKWRGTRSVVAGHVERVLREASSALTRYRADVLVVDQSDIAGGTVAHRLGLPFMTLCCAPPFLLHDDQPSTFVGWTYARGRLARARNRLGNAVVRRCVAPLLARLNEQRRAWGLPLLDDINDCWSSTGVIVQIPAALDLPSSVRSPPIFHVGPMRLPSTTPRVPFPWERLNGRPLIYASMGTIRNGDAQAFRTIAAACAHRGMQLVLSLGGGELLPEQLGPVAGHNPIVVHYAPQAELIQRAALVINCAGLNTTLDAVTAGVPIVAIPVAEDQPGVAVRIAHAGIGIVVPNRRLTRARLARAVDTVLGDPGYRSRVLNLQRQVAGLNGSERAADVVERVLLRDVGERANVSVNAAGGASGPTTVSGRVG